MVIDTFCDTPILERLFPVFGQNNVSKLISKTKYQYLTYLPVSDTFLSIKKGVEMRFIIFDYIILINEVWRCNHHGRALRLLREMVPTFKNEAAAR